MSGPTQIPVTGVFYNETQHFEDWLSSVENQRDDSIDPVPHIVVSRHPRFVGELRAILDRCIVDRRLRQEDVDISAENIGPTRAFNRAAEKVRNASDQWPWIASLDPDARFAPSALRRMYLIGESHSRIGMVSPIVMKPRSDGNYRRAVAAPESVCHAGHFPFQPLRPSASLLNYWQSHFKNWTFDDAKNFLDRHPTRQPFTACFCASLWSTRMFSEIGLPDDRQFRTLNCGEVGYRARLKGWSAKFSPDAFAFHPNAPDADYASTRAIAESGSTAWHYYHAQGLIALRYFPDNMRNVAARRGGDVGPWEYYFPDLAGIEADGEFDNDSRSQLVDRWREFDLRP